MKNGLSRPLSAVLVRSTWLFFTAVLALATVSHANAQLLLWPVEARSGLAEEAEQSNWSDFIRATAQAESLNLVLPSERGLNAYYPAVTANAPDLAVLSEGAALAGAQGSLWVKLDPVGALWVLVQGEGSSSVSTTATAEGFQQGIAWVNQQLRGAVTGSSNGMNNASAGQQGVSAPLPDPNFVYRAPGTEISVRGVRDTSDYLRLTNSIQSLSEVDFSYVSELSGTDAKVVVGSALGAFQLEQLLAQQPWLQPAEGGGFRWNSLASALPGQAERQLEPQ